MRTREQGSGLSLTEGHATPYNLDISKKLRQRMTPAEKVFWDHVRRRRYPGYRFRRNHPLQGFSVDFYCDRLKLVIEIDGAIHDRTQAYDKARTIALEALGVRVVRFTNEDIFLHLECVMDRIFSMTLRPPRTKPLR